MNNRETDMGNKDKVYMKVMNPCTLKNSSGYSSKILWDNCE